MTQNNPIKPSKRELTKQTLAARALVPLAAQGYAAIGLREIASELGVSLGSLHYYFNDKNELLSSSMQQYKLQSLGELQAITHANTPASEKTNAFVDLMCVRITQETQLHRLWFDMRVQALYNDELKEVIDQYEEAFSEVSRQLLSAIGSSTIPAAQASAIFSGLFFDGVRDALRGNTQAEHIFRTGINQLLVTAGLTYQIATKSSIKG